MRSIVNRAETGQLYNVQTATSFMRKAALGANMIVAGIAGLLKLNLQREIINKLLILRTQWQSIKELWVNRLTTLSGGFIPEAAIRKLILRLPTSADEATDFLLTSHASIHLESSQSLKGALKKRLEEHVKYRQRSINDRKSKYTALHVEEGAKIVPVIHLPGGDGALTEQQRVLLLKYYGKVSKGTYRVRSFIDAAKNHATITALLNETSSIFGQSRNNPAVVLGGTELCCHTDGWHLVANIYDIIDHKVGFGAHQYDWLFCVQLKEAVKAGVVTTAKVVIHGPVDPELIERLYTSDPSYFRGLEIGIAIPASGEILWLKQAGLKGDCGELAGQMNDILVRGTIAQIQALVGPPTDKEAKCSSTEITLSADKIGDNLSNIQPWNDQWGILLQNRAVLLTAQLERSDDGAIRLGDVNLNPDSLVEAVRRIAPRLFEILKYPEPERYKLSPEELPIFIKQYRDTFVRLQELNLCHGSVYGPRLCTIILDCVLDFKSECAGTRPHKEIVSVKKRSCLNPPTKPMTVQDLVKAVQGEEVQHAGNVMEVVGTQITPSERSWKEVEESFTTRMQQSVTQSWSDLGEFKRARRYPQLFKGGKHRNTALNALVDAITEAHGLIEAEHAKQEAVCSQIAQAEQTIANPIATQAAKTAAIAHKKALKEQLPGFKDNILLMSELFVRCVSDVVMYKGGEPPAIMGIEAKDVIQVVYAIDAEGTPSFDIVRQNSRLTHAQLLGGKPAIACGELYLARHPLLFHTLTEWRASGRDKKSPYKIWMINNRTGHYTTGLDSLTKARCILFTELAAVGIMPGDPLELVDYLKPGLLCAA